MDNIYDLISIGDTTIDIFLEISPELADSLCFLDKEKCIVGFGFGAKVPVNKLTRVAAVGNSANCAIGASRLGLKSAIFSITGSDQDSFETKRILEDEDVSVEFFQMEKDKRSNFSAVLNYSAERTIFVYHEPRNYVFPKLPNSSWIYYTSTGEGFDKLNNPLLEYLENGARLGFNPGSHQLKQGLAGLKKILEKTEVLILNREEAHGLVGGELQDIKNLLLSLKSTGPSIVVITDGPEGSYATIDGREIWFAGIPKESPVVERTGCGDAYSTGFIGALVLGKEIPDAMIWGTINATSVIQYIGAREGLLTQEGMKKEIGQWGSFIGVKII